jgi:antitoxin component YwqK of YwqJK toxin-antitoxin module
MNDIPVHLWEREKKLKRERHMKKFLFAILLTILCVNICFATDIGHVHDVRDEGLYGVCTEYYKNGNMKAQANSKNNKLNGKYYEYYENGNIKEVSNYKDNELIGEVMRYDDGGRLSQILNYKNKAIVDYYSYYREGGVRRFSNYKNGQLEGETILYLENGDVEAEYMYVDGKKIKGPELLLADPNVIQLANFLRCRF